MSIYSRKDRLIIIGGVCALLLATLSAPVASAQTPATPTPRPAIEATRQAAQAQLDAANRDIEEAARRDAQNAEYRRNAEAQQASAAANMQAAEVAIAVRDTAASASALGRAQSDLAALSASVAGLTKNNAESGAVVRLQAMQIVSLTNRVTALETDKATISAAYAATVQRADEAEQAGAGSSPLLLIVVLAFIGLLGFVLIIVLSRKPTIPPSVPQAVPVAYDAIDPLD